MVRFESPHWHPYRGFMGLSGILKMTILNFLNLHRWSLGIQTHEEACPRSPHSLKRVSPQLKMYQTLHPWQTTKFKWKIQFDFTRISASPFWASSPFFETTVANAKYISIPAYDAGPGAAPALLEDNNALNLQIHKPKTQQKQHLQYSKIHLTYQPQNPSKCEVHNANSQ